MGELTQKPDFKAIEEKQQKFWEKEKIYKFDTKSRKKIFRIDTPPPYISGRPHMGHAVSYTGFEFIARYKRMAGFNVFFPIGFDDNGQPTERFVEKTHNVKSSEVSREKFIELCRKETEELEKFAKTDLTKLGHSYDWDLFYSTISKNAVRISQLSFLDLYKKKLAYRSEEPGLWCPDCQTALSQADVEDAERETTLNYIFFELENGGKIEIATTRPEFLPACVGIFVHPHDKRYKKLVGKKAVVPIFGNKVQIMKDEKVDMSFGSGIVMVCTFGDKTDIEWWKKHKLPMKIIIEKNGKLNSSCGKFSGMNFSEAKKSILAELQERGLLKEQKPMKQNVGTCWRCHTPVEFIVTKQWAIKVLKNKNKLLKQADKIKWFPEYHKKRYIDWVQNLGWDWIISRQRHYGVPMPIWYCRKCGREILADKKELPVYPEKSKPKKKCRCGSKNFIPELDVFDTWMTSSLTPYIVSEFSEKIIPFDLRPQGYEIIRTWAFTTILKALYHFKKIPWRDILVNGMVLGHDGKAMHKSKGNYIEPMFMVEKYCADAMRYFASTVNIGEDAPFQEKELVRGQSILIKLWNVARFCSQNLLKNEKCKQQILDRWILSRLSETIKTYKKSFDKYDFVNARRELERFFMQDFCDFYLEMVKYRIYGQDKESKISAQQTLYKCLLAVLKLWAVFIPHITEEIYRNLFAELEKAKSIHISNLPDAEKEDREALELGEIACSVISEIRKWKQFRNMSLGAEVGHLVVSHPEMQKLKKIKQDIQGTMRIKNLELIEGELKATE